MKALSPSKIVALGPPLLGVVFSVAIWLVTPTSSRDWSSFGWTLGIGTAGGLAVFGPIAGVLAIWTRWPQWLAQHSWRISFYSSIVMGVSMGYLAACTYHRVSDNLMLIAYALVFLGATIKATLSYALRNQR